MTRVFAIEVTWPPPGYLRRYVAMIARNQQSHRIVLCVVLCALISTGLVVSSFESVSRNHDLDTIADQLHEGTDDSLLTTIAAAQNARPTPVVLSGQSVTSESEQRIDIHLAIGDGYEIYSEREHQILLPMKTEVLDAQLRPIRSRIQYPQPTAVPTDDPLVGVFFVYRGNIKIVATSASESRPAYIRVFFNGSYKGHT